MSTHEQAQSGWESWDEGAGVFAAQMLVDLKNPDPAGRTAEEAIRNLLGFGDCLVDLRRREFHELLCAPKDGTNPEESQLAPLLLRYLQTTVLLWNSNKQRAWLRLRGAGESPGPWEAFPARAEPSGAFGAPGLEEPGFDHIMVWRRGHRERIEDLAPALTGWSVLAEGSCELYSLRWRENASSQERRLWTEGVATTSSRDSGLLVNPHYQDHRLLFGLLPVPFWSNGRSARGLRAC